MGYFCIEDMPQGAVMDPWFLETYTGKGLPVRVESGDCSRVYVKVLDE